MGEDINGPGSKPPLPELALELHNLIIEELQSDRTALLTCSLVCSSWSSFTKRHIFRSVKIPPHNLAHLSTILDASSRMRSTIENLSISWMFPVKGAALARTPFQHRPIIDLQSFYALISKLPELKALSLQQVAFSGSPTLVLLSAAARLKLDRLELDDAGDSYSTIYDLVNFLALFSEIAQVQLSRVAVDMIDSDVDEQVEDLLRQHSFEATAIASLAINDCRRASLLFRSLRKATDIDGLILCVDSQDVQDARDLASIVRATKTELTQLELTLRWFAGFELVMTDFTPFGLCHRLASILFRVVIADRATNQFGLIAVWQAYAGILQCSSPSVREVTLEFVFRGELVEYLDRSDYIDWDLMREALHSLPQLSRVIVAFTSLAVGAMPDFEAGREIVKEKLADFDTTEVLELR